MTRTQWICNLAVFPFVCAAIALFLAVNLIVDLIRYGKVRPCHD